MLELISSISTEIDAVKRAQSDARVLRELAELPDRQTMSTNFKIEDELSPIYDALSRIENAVDSTKVLQEIKQLKTLANYEAYAAAVHDRIRNHTFKVDQSEVTQMLSQSAETDVQALSEALHKQFLTKSVPVNNAEVLHAIEQLEPKLIERMREVTSESGNGGSLSSRGQVLDQQAMTSAVEECLDRMTIKTDNSELLRLLERIDQRLDFAPILDAIASAAPDVTAIKKAIGSDDRLGNATLKAEISELLGLLERIEPVAESIESLPHLLTPIQNAISDISYDVGHRQVLQEIRKLEKIDYEALASAVHDRIRDQALTADQAESRSKSEVDVRALSEAITEGLLNTKLPVDNSEVLQALGRLEPDHGALSTALIEKMMQQTWKIDHGELQRALTSIVHDSLTEYSVDLTAVHAAIRDIKVVVDYTPILSAVQQVERIDYDKMASIVHDRIRDQTFKADHTEVLQVLSRMKPEIDVQSLGDVIHEKFMTASLARSSLDSEVLHAIHDAIRGITVDPAPLVQAIGQMDIFNDDEIRKFSGKPDCGNTSVMIAVNAATQNLVAVHERMDKMHIALDDCIKQMQARRMAHDLDLSSILAEIRQMGAPDHNMIADVVVSKLKPIADVVVADVVDRGSDLSVAMRALGDDMSSLRERLLKAIEDADVDLSPVTEAINSVGVNLVTIMTEIKQLLRSERRVETECRIPQAAEIRTPVSATKPPCSPQLAPAPFSATWQVAPPRTSGLVVAHSAGAMQSTRVRTPSPDRRSATPVQRLGSGSAVACVAPARIDAQKATPRVAHMPQTQQRQVDIAAPRTVIRQRSLEALPTWPAETVYPVDLPAPRPLDQHQNTCQTGSTSSTALPQSGASSVVGQSSVMADAADASSSPGAPWLGTFSAPVQVAAEQMLTSAMDSLRSRRHANEFAAQAPSDSQVSFAENIAFQGDWALDK
jgi:hypothetical protein